MTRTSHPSLSTRASALRSSLLLALGLSPLVACGGSVVTQGGGDAGSDQGGRDGAGAPSYAGRSPTAGANNGGASSGGSAGSPYCDRPVIDPVSGLVNCQNGFEHRPKAVTCTLPDTGAAGSAGEGGASAGEAPPMQCTDDAQCAALPLGYCDRNDGFQGGAQCKSGCLQDSDCGDSAVCVCDGTAHGGECVYSDCKVDADCGPKAYCATASGICGGTTFACTKQEDECLGGSECPNGTCYDNSDHRSCDPGGVCGRPFLIEEAARTADVEPRRDWLDLTIAPDLSGLSPLQRAQLAAHWSRLGQMEHASIAAFARFNLQLLALGAPADLVEACNQALVDETAHARLCFAFASAYAGTKLGPSKLDMSHCFEETTLLSVTKLVIAEGCIGETSAALEAREDADNAIDPVVRNALLRIASDEQRHAELAYRFLRWALAQCTTEQRAELALETERQIVAFEQSADRSEQRVAVRSIVRPLLDALRAEQRVDG